MLPWCSLMISVSGLLPTSFPWSFHWLGKQEKGPGNEAGLLQEFSQAQVKARPNSPEGACQTRVTVSQHPHSVG